jgi:hypothetical protein
MVILSFRGGVVDSVCHAATRFWASSSKAFANKNWRGSDMHGGPFDFVEPLTAIVFKAKDKRSTNVPNGV